MIFPALLAIIPGITYLHVEKTEVRFVNEKPIFDVVYHGSKTALLKGDTPKEISLKTEDIIPHKQPNVFSFDKSPYSKKPEKPTQLPLVSADQYKKAEENKTE